jgi:2-furoyl-CoA dehydrogenase FAD binding subunit
VLAAAGGEARVLAGGQSLVAMLNMRLARPGVLVDIMRIPALAGITQQADAIVVGAGVRQAALQELPGLGDRLPLVAAMLPWLGHMQTRSRGTVCGSLAHADPSAELPLALVALGGEVRLRARRRHRSVPAERFFLGMMATDLADDEMIEAAAFPVGEPGTGYAFREIARRHGDFAIVGCAAVVGQDTARLAVGGVADRPVAREVPMPGDTDLDEALNEFAWSLDARDDIHATARYRRDLVRSIGRATLEEAARCRA